MKQTVGRRSRHLLAVTAALVMCAGLGVAPAGAAEGGAAPPVVEAPASAAAVEEAALAGGRAYGPPGGAWGLTSESGVFVFGSRGYTQGYSWSVAAGSSARVCVNVRAYSATYPRGYWYSAGCGTRGSVSAPWGNVGALPAVRVRSITGLGAPVAWFH